LIDQFRDSSGKSLHQDRILVDRILIGNYMNTIRTEIHHLDVGQGDCCLILVYEVLDDGNGEVLRRSVLIDCGSTDFNGLGPYDGMTEETRPGTILLQTCVQLGVQHLDVAVITHYESDHISGILDLLTRAKLDPMIRQLFQRTYFYDRGEIRRHHQNKPAVTSLSISKTQFPSFISLAMQPYVGSQGEKNELYLQYVASLYALRNLHHAPAELQRKSEFIRASASSGVSLELKHTQFTTVENATWNAETFNFYRKGGFLGCDILNHSFDDQIDGVSLTIVAVNCQAFRADFDPPFINILGTSLKENDKSIALLLKMNTFTYWFPGELVATAERQCIPALQSIGLQSLSGTKVAHHGAESSTSELFLDTFRPKIATISCGPDNTHGHPSGRVMNLLEGRNFVQTVFLTGYGGDPDDPRNPRYRSPFNRDLKFQFAGSDLYNRAGHVAIIAEWPDPNVERTEFSAYYFAQNLNYDWVPIQDAMQGEFPGWDVILARYILDHNENPRYENMTLNNVNGVVSVMNENRELLGYLNPRGGDGTFRY
jgi:beta-lactamase superfamily II metal-dependent hydrolase